MPTSNDIRSTIHRHHSDFILPRLHLASYNLGVDSRIAHRSINDPVSGISSSSPHSRICRLSYLICKRTNYFSFRNQFCWLLIEKRGALHFFSPYIRLFFPMLQKLFPIKFIHLKFIHRQILMYGFVLSIKNIFISILRYAKKPAYKWILTIR